MLVSTGQNPVPMFRGAVNCLTTDSPDVGVNLATAPVPASSDGDATIKAAVDLPDPCVAPIVFVTSGTGPPPGQLVRGDGPLAELFRPHAAAVSTN